MEKLQAPIIPYLVDEQGIIMSISNYGGQMASFRCPNTDPQPPILDDKYSQLEIGSSIIVSNDNNKEKSEKKRNKTRKRKNKEQEETQRMTHIAVERNRRLQMNVHLHTLRSLMPPSYSLRGDQASIIGGAIEYIKELEQLLQMQSLQARKRMSHSANDVVLATYSSSNLQGNQLQFTSTHSHTHDQQGNGNGNGNEEDMSVENRSGIEDIEMVVIQNQVNLKIQCQRRPGLLLKAIFAFEQLRLTVLHLNVTSLHSFVHYSFNLKIEDDCKLGSAKEVATAVRQIFSFINVA